MARKIVAEFDAVTGPFLQKLNTIDRSINRFERNATVGFTRVERRIDGAVAAAGRLRNVSGLIAGGFGINIATSFVDQAAQIRNALREAGDDSQKAFEEVYLSSVRSLAGFKDTTVGVQRFQKALGDRQTLSETIRDLETLNKLLALTGKTTQERSSTMIQFSQALQAGYLGGEELRAVRESAPIDLTRAIAREAGGTIEDLKDLSIQGKLTTDVMLRALKSLEEEADRRFKNVQVTIQDAAKIFQSGALVATEGFDRGLGMSRAAVTGLKTLGQILGSNAEAFERFGEAAKIAGIALATTFAGRRVDNFTAGLQDAAKARAADVAASKAQLVTARQLQVQELARVQTARQNLATTIAAQAAAQQNLVTLTAQNASKKDIAKAQTLIVTETKKHATAQQRVISATQKLGVANQAVVASTVALDAALTRATFGARALASAGAMLRGAWAFMGGWPGLLITAGAALFTYRQHLSATVAKQEELLRVEQDHVDVLTKSRNIQREIAALDSQGGEDASQTGLIQALKQEQSDTVIQMRQLRDVELDLRKSALDLRQARIDALEEEQQKLAEIEAQRRELATPPGEEGSGFNTFGIFNPNQRQEQFDQFQSDMESRAIAQRAIIAEMEADIGKITASIVEREAKIRDLTAQIAESTGAEKGRLVNIRASLSLVSKHLEDATSDSDKLRETIASLEMAQSDLAQEFDSSAPVMTALNDLIRQMKKDLSDAEGEVSGFRKELRGLAADMRGLTSFRLDLSDQIRVVRAQVSAARAGVSAARVEAMPDAGARALEAERAGLPYSEVQQIYKDTLDLNEELAGASKELDGLLNPDTGGSSGAKKELNDLTSAAQSFIESMMTEEESRAKEMADVLKLRAELAAANNADVALLEALDKAIERAKDSFLELNQQREEFFESLSDQIASSIEDWKGWGSFVRSILADVVRTHGVDFFTALFTPGKQSGGSAGTTAGNWLTAGIWHEGGNTGSKSARTRQVPASAFANAPRFHNGLFPNEMPAILERGETVIPKGMSLGGGNMAMTMNVDLRGADPSMRPFIEGKLNELRQEFPRMFIKTTQELRRSRINV